jgi:hypothetical protein
MHFGGGASQIEGWLSLAVLVALSPLALVSEFKPAWLVAVNPALADARFCAGVQMVFAGASGFMLLRSWAVECRKTLLGGPSDFRIGLGA